MSLVESLEFRIYTADAVVEAKGNMELATQVKGSPVVLLVNPKEIRWEKPRIVEKTTTQKPGRFIYADWGLDVPKLEISGQTGNLLLDDTDKNQKDQLVRAVMLQIGAVTARIPTGQTEGSSMVSGGLSSTLEKMPVGELIEYLPYSQILALSPKYNKFKDLESLYSMLDANQQIMVLIIGQEYHRGIITNFGFTQSVDSPWNWNYSITFEIIEPRIWKSSGVWAVSIERTDKGVVETHREQYVIKEKL
jgi:hypothetical protein